MFRQRSASPGTTAALRAETLRRPDPPGKPLRPGTDQGMVGIIGSIISGITITPIACGVRARAAAGGQPAEPQSRGPDKTTNRTGCHAGLSPRCRTPTTSWYGSGHGLTAANTLARNATRPLSNNTSWALATDPRPGGPLTYPPRNLRRHDQELPPLLERPTPTRSSSAQHTSTIRCSRSRRPDRQDFTHNQASAWRAQTVDGFFDTPRR